MKDPDLLGPFPFRLGIHAAKQIDRDTWAWEPLYTDVPTVRDNVDAIAADCALVGLPDIDPVDVLRERVTRGALLGTVEVTGCHHADECRTPIPTMTGVPTFDYCSRWAEPDAWHWTLADPQPLDVPIPICGRQGLWRLPAEVTADA